MQENKSQKGYKVHLHFIGTTLDGAVVAINNQAVGVGTKRPSPPGHVRAAA